MMQLPQSFKWLVSVSTVVLALSVPVGMANAQDEGTTTQELPPLELPALPEGESTVAEELTPIPMPPLEQMEEPQEVVAPVPQPVQPQPVVTEENLAEQPEAEQSNASQTAAPAEAEWSGSLMFDEASNKNLLAIYRAYLIRQQQLIAAALSDGSLPL